MTYSRTNMSPMSIIVAVDEEGEIGKNGKIPWHNKDDFKRFKEITMGKPCVMGRRTYEDVRTYQKKKDEEITEILPGRQTFVITSDEKFNAPGATVVSSLREAVQSLDHNDTRPMFVLGGEQAYVESLAWTDIIYMTVIDGIYDCDRFFPIKALSKFRLAAGERGEGCNFLEYRRIRP